LRRYAIHYDNAYQKVYKVMRVGEEEQWNEDEEPVVIVCYRDQLLENGDIYVT
jgi:hypothetical protein